MRPGDNHRWQRGEHPDTGQRISPASHRRNFSRDRNDVLDHQRRSACARQHGQPVDEGSRDLNCSTRGQRKNIRTAGDGQNIHTTSHGQNSRACHRQDSRGATAGRCQETCAAATASCKETGSSELEAVETSQKWLELAEAGTVADITRSVGYRPVTGPALLDSHTHCLGGDTVRHHHK